MKKNMISVLILALLIINVILTAVMMFSVTGAANKTSALVTDIASVLQIEIGTQEQEVEVPVVSLENTAVYDIPDSMTIMLSKGEDDAAHYAIVEISLSMDIKNKGYKTYGETIADKVSLIRAEIIEVIGSYTLEEASGNEAAISQEILARLQAMFESNFIYKVSFRDVMFQ